MLLSWNKHKATFSITLNEKIIVQGQDTLWLSAINKASYEKSESGMIQYNHKMDKIINIVRYPKRLRPTFHSVCNHKDKIYIIDGDHEEIFLFDPDSQLFTKQASIPKIGYYARPVIIFNKIHIFHGSKNSSHHLIYDPDTNNVSDHRINTRGLAGFAIFLYQNRIIKVGGNYCDTGYDATALTNSVSISSILTKYDIGKVPEFEDKPKWRLPLPLRFFGHVLYKHYLLIFGGITTNNNYIDSIHLLDLDDDNGGWKELRHIKCPHPSVYIATLTGDGIECNVHLFTRINKWPDWKESKTGSYSLPILEIVGPEIREFDVSILKVIDTTTIDIVNGYIRNEQKTMIRAVPQEIIDICVIYYYWLRYN